ncbi:methionine ABC transporter permease [Deinococcus pimensis]|uniref:methionine ABC transporter permease n=1 Tax=Deinococcus pimensis TaxID=309888 RepID=UPI000483769D|nr:methionine ABC transporter permease [Deinococcus pimensis]
MTGVIRDLLTQGTLETLLMVVPSALVAQLLGTLLGVVLVITRPGHLKPSAALNRALGVIVNVGRSLPFIILLVLLIPFTRLITGTSIGSTAAIVPLTVAAIPFTARLVESALLDVPTGVVEAVRVMGARTWQIVVKVLLPEARPALILGFTVMTISLVGYSAMAGAIGGGGLGDIAIRYGYQRFETTVMIATVVILVALVQLVQFLGDRIARRVDHR